MTSQTILTDQLLREVLERRAGRARVDGLLDGILQAAAATPQHRRWTWRPSWPATRRASLGLVPLAIAVALVSAVLVVPRFLGPAAPSPSPSPTPGPSVPAIRGGWLQAPTLAAGRYATSLFRPSLLLTVPDRVWAPVVDAERQLLLRARLPGVSADENDSLTLVTITNVYDNACADGPARSIPWTLGSDPAAFLDWLEAEMSFDFGPRTTGTILGRPALEVDFIAPDLAHCEGGTLSITDAGPVNPFGSNPAGQRARYAVFELNGQTVLVGIWTTDPARRDVVWAAANAVLESLEIAP